LAEGPWYKDIKWKQGLYLILETDWFLCDTDEALRLGWQEVQDLEEQISDLDSKIERHVSNRVKAFLRLFTSIGHYIHHAALSWRGLGAGQDDDGRRTTTMDGHGRRRQTTPDDEETTRGGGWVGGWVGGGVMEI
jgi:hypothetical protein